VKRKRSPGGWYTRSVQSTMQGGLISLQRLQGFRLVRGEFYVCGAKG
jgi:hypothetical protein